MSASSPVIVRIALQGSQCHCLCPGGGGGGGTLGRWSHLPGLHSPRGPAALVDVNHSVRLWPSLEVAEQENDVGNKEFCCKDVSWRIPPEA